MKCNLKLTQLVIIFGLLLCTILLAVESAPTFESRHKAEPALHVLPLEQSTSAGGVPAPVTYAEPSDTPIPSYSRSKRAIIFRPLFVYRQQQIKKQRVQNLLVPQTGR